MLREREYKKEAFCYRENYKIIVRSARFLEQLLEFLKHRFEFH